MSDIPDIAPVAPHGAEPAFAGAVLPSDQVRTEIERLLDADQSRLGQVFRAQRRGLDADAIAAELNVGSTTFVWSYNRTARALIDGDLPTAPTVALRAARPFRTMLKSRDLSDAARSYLMANLEELDRRANDEARRADEDQYAKEQTEQAEALGEHGIYVYALPHYLRYPYEPDSGRTLMKVGRSDNDVIMRFRSQTRTTALPEEPVLLRIYKTDGTATAKTESDFHRLLEAADHSRSVTRSAGREWFVTSTRFLDEVARVLKLPVVVVNDAVDLDAD